jgi:DNA-directed RNA polymerase subunit RPC12/RpoP
MVSCPECGSTYVRRIARTPLMRLLWNSKHILCSDCGERSLVLPGLTAYLEKRRQAQGRFKLQSQPPRRPLARSSVRT